MHIKVRVSCPFCNEELTLDLYIDEDGFYTTDDPYETELLLEKFTNMHLACYR